MPDSQGFDYNQPSRDALAGIYVEVSDSAAEMPAALLPGAQEEPVALAQVERLFGLTVSVDDENLAERPSRTPNGE